MSPRKVVMCSSLGGDEVFKHRMALKRYLDRNQCVGVSKQKMFGYVCLKCNSVIKQLSNTTRRVNKCKGAAPKTKLSKSETGEYKCTCESTFAFAS